MVTGSFQLIGLNAGPKILQSTVSGLRSQSDRR